MTDQTTTTHASGPGAGHTATCEASWGECSRPGPPHRCVRPLDHRGDHECGCQAQVPQCGAEYERVRGRERGDRIVRCDLAAGHDGDHEELATESTWAADPTTTATHASGPRAGQPVTPDDGDAGGPYPGQGWVWLTPSTIAVPCLDCQRPVMVAIAEVGRRWRCSRCDPSGRVADAGPSPHIAVTDRSEPSGAAPAAAGPHPDTPDRAAALQEAERLIRRRLGAAWDNLADEDPVFFDQLAHEAADAVRDRLVSPAAGRVLDAARRVARSGLDAALDWRQLADDYRELRAALAALDGDQPAPTELLRTPAACGALAPADDPDDHECDLGACHSGPHECAGCGATWRDAAEALDGDQPAEPGPPPPEPAIGEGAGYESVADIQRQQLHATATNQTGLLAGVKMAEPGAASSGASGSTPAAEPAPERDACGYGRPPCNRPAGHPGVHYRLPAPEPDSGPGWDRAVIACPKCRAARAELAEARDHGVLKGEALDRAQAEIARLNRVVDHRDTALATARRDAARSALNYAGTNAHSVGERDRLFRLAEDFGSGTRPVPGSPQPADQAPACPCGCNPNGEPTAHVTLPFPCLCGIEHGTYADAYRAHQGDPVGSSASEGGGDDGA